jgi:hypothetical protein
MKACNLAKDNCAIDETVSQRFEWVSNLGLLELIIRSLVYCYCFSRIMDRRRNCAGSMEA